MPRIRPNSFDHEDALYRVLHRYDIKHCDSVILDIGTSEPVLLMLERTYNLVDKWFHGKRRFGLVLIPCWSPYPDSELESYEIHVFHEDVTEIREHALEGAIVNEWESIAGDAAYAEKNLLGRGFILDIHSLDPGQYNVKLEDYIDFSNLMPEELI